MWDERVWAPHDSLLGRLERGTGAGFLAALAAPEAARPFIIDCVLRDPRWDYQLDDTAGYYAHLMIRLGLEPAPVIEHLRRPASDGVRTWLAFDVLCGLTCLGHGAAAEALVDYVAWGEHWGEALDALGERALPLLPIAERRYEEDQAANRVIPWLDFERPPFDAWPEQSEVIRARREAQRPTPPPQRPDYGTMTVDEVLEAARYSGHRALLPRLRQVLTVDHLSRLTELLEAPRYAQRAAAVAGLGAIGDRAALPILHDWLLAAEPPDEGPFPVGAAAEALLALDRDQARLVARGWAAGERWHLHRIGTMILEQAAIREDAPLLRDLIRRGLDEHNYYTVAGAARGLVAAGVTGPVPELAEAFERSVYGYCRAGVAEAAERLAPGWLAARFATESLWDADECVRLWAMPLVESGDLRVRERLSELASDPLLDSDERELAVAQLLG